MEWDMIDDTLTEPIDPRKTHYTMITGQIAVGSLYSPYDDFDVIVNMAFRYEGDGFTRHHITTTTESGKTIYRIGIHDTPLEPLDRILPPLIPVLHQALHDHKRILIHCQAGMSRSASVAVALLAISQNLSFTEALSYVVLKRPIVKPNDGFMVMTREFLHTRE